MTKSEVTNDQIMTALTQFADNVDKRFDKLEDDVAELKSDVGELKSDVNRIYGILDSHMSRIETFIQEAAVQKHQQDRLERWIFQLADQAGVKLRYDAS